MRGLVLSLLLGSAFAAAAAPLPCKEDDKACAFEAARKHRVHLAERWTDAFRKPVEERLGPAPDDLIEALTLDNIANGFAERPKAAKPSAAFMRDFRAALEELPAPVRRILGPGFAGLYFVEHLGGTGFTNMIRDPEGPVGAYVVLDVAVLEKHRANAWATWKEGTPFKPDANVALRARLQPDASDTRKNAIQYILLHELGHVLSVRAQVHPDWTLFPKHVPPSQEYPFFRLSWKVDREGNRYESLFEDVFPQRKDVAYYVGAKLGAKDMPAVYSALEKTNFPTLYAATHPGDDFAEAFANYIHVVLLGRPFAIEIVERGRVVKAYGSCWSEPRCAEKRRMLEELLAR